MNAMGFALSQLDSLSLNLQQLCIIMYMHGNKKNSLATMI